MIERMTVALIWQHSAEQTEEEEAMIDSDKEFREKKRKRF